MERHMERVGQYGALAVGLMGAMVLIAWYSGVAALTTILPGHESMKPNTAMALLALALAVAMLNRGWPVLPVGVFTVVLGSVTLLEHLGGQSLGIDRLPGIDFGSDAPRMAPSTAVSLVLLGSAVIAAAQGRTRLMRGFALVNLLVAHVALLGYAYGVSSLYRVAGATAMAVHTAVCIAVLSLSILLLDPSAGLASLFMDRGGTGRLARRMVPFVCLAPFLLGWLRLWAQDLGWFDTEYGVSILVMSMTLLGGLVTWRATLSLRVLDRQRDDAVQSLAEANRTLESTVAERTRELAAIVDQSDDAIIAKTLDGKITSWNPAAETVYGYSIEEMLDTSSERLSPEGRTAEIISVLARVGAGVDVEPFETLRVHKDGTVFPVLLTVSPIRDADGVVVGAFTISRDMTKATEAFDAARAMIESSLDALVAISPEGVITDANEATVKATGIPRMKLIGTAFSECFTEPEKAEAIYNLVFEQGVAMDYPLTLRHHDGHETLTEVLYNASVYRDGRGKVRGVFAAARDVTDQNRARKEIAHQQAIALGRLAELEQIHRVTIGREVKMIELKKENEYLRKFGPVHEGEQSGAY
jgi:PAS domain S-box-containing protein